MSIRHGGQGDASRSQVIREAVDRLVRAVGRIRWEFGVESEVVTETERRSCSVFRAAGDLHDDVGFLLRYLLQVGLAQYLDWSVLRIDAARI
jgi:hypothetical protein